MFVPKNSRSASLIYSKLISPASRVFNHQIHSQKVLVEKSERDVQVTVNNETLKFPSVWLRDNCQCDKCFHPTARSRILDWSTFDVNVKPFRVVEAKNSVEITWNDGHTSKFGLDWLKLRSFSPKHQKKYTDSIYRPAKIIWRGDEFQDICSRHVYSDILTSDKAFHAWLNELSVYGVALIENTPNSDDALDALIDKIGFSKQTHYGVKFVVQNLKKTSSNIAYLSNNLQFHTDLSYYDYGPGANLLHCVTQTKNKGGENLLTDAHYVAGYIKRNHPQQYKLLTEVDVEWNDIGKESDNEFYKMRRAPIISVDKYGNIERISFSVAQRASHFPVDIEDVQPWYEAYLMFLELNHKFAAEFKMKSGDILTFDNLRLLHSRNGYEDNEDNVRKLIGAYIDWDEIYSRLRSLKIKLDKMDGISNNVD